MPTRTARRSPASSVSSHHGSRYSWGYPACPDLEDQVKLDELLSLDRIGVNLTEEFQLEPEQSTCRDHRPPPRSEIFCDLEFRFALTSAIEASRIVVARSLLRSYPIG